MLLSILLIQLFISSSFFLLVLSDDDKKPDHYEALGLDSKDVDEVAIKKAFRALALIYHPDKINANNLTEIERDNIHQKFLEIQDAYEVLSDPERKQKYDLSLLDVTYDIYEDDVGNRYTSSHFHMFVRTKKMKMSFSADFQPNIIPPIMIPLEVNLSDIFTGIRLERTFYRRVECPVCSGTG